MTLSCKVPPNLIFSGENAAIQLKLTCNLGICVDNLFSDVLNNLSYVCVYLCLVCQKVNAKSFTYLGWHSIISRC